MSGWWPPFAEAGNNVTVGKKKSLTVTLVTKPYLIETASFSKKFAFAGGSTPVVDEQP